MAKGWTMTRIALAPAINAQMYRHFAAATLAITALVALFANGESRETLQHEVETREAQRALREEQAEKHDFRRGIVSLKIQPATSGDWDSAEPTVDGDTTGSYVPDDMEITEPTGNLRPDAVAPANASALPVPPPGIPANDHAQLLSPAGTPAARRAPPRRLTPAEQEQLRRALGDKELAGTN